MRFNQQDIIPRIKIFAWRGQTEKGNYLISRCYPEINIGITYGHS